MPPDDRYLERRRPAVVVVVTVEAVVIVLLAVLVAGLLRSHAEILRRLHVLGAGLDRDVPVELRARSGSANGDLVGPGGVPVRVGDGTVFDVAGRTPWDEAVSVALTPARVDTLLAFLSSGCTTCQAFWEAFRDERSLGLPSGARLVVVTKGHGGESPATLRRMAPPDVPVIMSDEAWEDYRVPGSPYFIYVNGPDGAIAGEGSAATWPEVVSLLRDALDDAAAQRSGPDFAGDDREARADRALMAAGILPGDPRLYPPADGSGAD